MKCLECGRKYKLMEEGTGSGWRNFIAADCFCVFNPDDYEINPKPTPPPGIVELPNGSWADEKWVEQKAKERAGWPATVITTGDIKE